MSIKSNFISALRGRISGAAQDIQQLDRATQALLFVFVVFVVFSHLGIERFNDDLFFTDFDKLSLQFLGLRYIQWTSRVFIELVLLPVSCLPIFVFNSLNVLILLVLPFLLARLVAPKHEWGKLLFPAICFVVMYPFIFMASAGWITTCVNYLWPLVALLFAVLPLRKLYDGVAVSAYEYVFSMLCLVFACNNELICGTLVIVLPVYAFFLGRQYLRIMAVYMAITLASLAFIVYCPGNASRSAQEIVTWLPQFNSLSFLQKVYYSYMGFIVPLFFYTNYIFLGLTSVLCFGVFQRYTALPLRVSAVLPFFALLLTGPSWWVSESTLSVLLLNQYLLFLLSFFVILSLALSIWLLADSVREYVLVISLLAGTFCARGAMAFSPTMFASGPRTALYVYAALAIAALWTYWRIRDTLSEGLHSCCRAVLLVFALLSFLK